MILVFQGLMGFLVPRVHQGHLVCSIVFSRLAVTILKQDGITLHLILKCLLLDHLVLQDLEVSLGHMDQEEKWV